jgi:hypothetical protein
MTIPSYRAIENLIASYAELVDHGDFAGVGVLLAYATFTGAAGDVSRHLRRSTANGQQ